MDLLLVRKDWTESYKGNQLNNNLKYESPSFFTRKPSLYRFSKLGLNGQKLGLGEYRLYSTQKSSITRYIN